MSDQTSNTTVLIVDDMPDSIEILNQILKDEYRVLFAISGHM